MKLKQNLVGISAAALIFISGLLTVHFVARAVETSSSIRVDNTPINRDPSSGNSYAPIVKKVAPSVVNIYSSKTYKERRWNPFLSDPFFRQFFGLQGDGGQVTRRAEWLGCGIVVAPDGYILTANHVVEGADEIKVVIGNGKEKYSAKVVGMDPPTDVAVLKIEAQNLPAVTLGDSDQLEVGDVVLAIGNPFGVGQTVTRGIISALGRSLSAFGEEDSVEARQYQNFIQTDAAINEGNSGGALVDTEGRLIGINDAIVSPSGTSAGIGFAVPINLARSVMEGFIRHGQVERGFMGIEPQDIDSDLAKGFGAPTAEGALVADVTPGSPAAKAGLQSGDIIVAIDGKDITGADNLRVVVSELAPGAQARVKFYRNSAPKTVVVTLAERPDMAQDPARPGNNTVEPAKADALDGVEVEDLSTQLRRELGAPRTIAGALITNVDRASNSYEAGLRIGDIILEINRQAVANADDAVRLCKAARTQEILVKIWHPERGTSGGLVRFLSVDNTKRAS